MVKTPPHPNNVGGRRKIFLTLPVEDLREEDEEKLLDRSERPCPTC